MKLIDMKSDSGQGPGCAPTPCDSEYPWGLRLCLDEPTLVKLGIKGLPKPGSEMTLQATACVGTVGASEGDRDTPRRDVTLQIIAMALGGGKSPASVLFGSDE